MVASVITIDDETAMAAVRAIEDHHSGVIHRYDLEGNFVDLNTSPSREHSWRLPGPAKHCPCPMGRAWNQIMDGLAAR